MTEPTGFIAGLTPWQMKQALKYKGGENFGDIRMKNLGKTFSYEDAFYQLAELMEIPAQALSPQEVWETQMLPVLKKAYLYRPGSGMDGFDMESARIGRAAFRRLVELELIRDTSNDADYAIQEINTLIGPEME